MTKLHATFSVPILETDIGYTSGIIDYINTLEYQRTAYDNADISISMDVLENPLFKEYSKKINYFVQIFCYDYVRFDKNFMKLERTSSWSNRYHPNDWCQYHTHSNSFVTGVWYLETPENGGDLDLHSHRSSFGDPISFGVVEDNDINNSMKTIECSPGKLVIFPSIIGHSVEKNRSNKIRSCIAFNYYARGEVISEDKSFYI